MSCRWSRWHVDSASPCLPPPSHLCGSAAVLPTCTVALGEAERAVLAVVTAVASAAVAVRTARLAGAAIVTAAAVTAVAVAVALLLSG